ncbi:MULTISPECIES: hypothetical protein [Nostoc]|jgi:hypothetical protein|uniref:Uncharacterized protein n=1 Tax=Nostoc punctiforme FACHB-252 TaxID=1357509 RepID=A0ABR8HF32_NOSPU|nr:MULTISPECIES: hypothetical protein [Nostoc]MBC1236607.1 hypothetical protein [Nostoc sp. 2RC]MBD2613708.1 hypothetical protein [Nostoc punctiforme FACHB-252]MDZ8012508.1 hypothetical protein [Nostoc sp. ZfuVER08]
MFSWLAFLGAKVYGLNLVQLVWVHRQTKQVPEIKIIESQIRLGAINQR